MHDAGFVIVVGLAALYVWYLLAHASLFDKPFGWPREHWGPLWMCPWCAGFWIVGLILLLTGSYDIGVHLAATAVTGLAGTHV